MKLLVDTHIALWWITGSDKLSRKGLTFLDERENELLVSIASIWEVAIKHRLHPDRVSMSEVEYAKYCGAAGFNVLPIKIRHIFALRTLTRPETAPKHQDPFDRIMIAQAKTEQMFFLTHDALLPYYNEPYILFV